MNSSADLLKELRIDRKAPPPAPPSRRGLWITLAVVAVLLALAAAAWALLGREKPIEVRTAPTVALGGGGASASVLDASGYVVARRMATVSAKVTGKVQEVLIEEGMRVEAGQVLARLEPIDADADRALSQSQLQAARSQTGGVQAQLVEAEANARRLSSLVAQQLVSKAQYDQAIAQRDLLRAQLLTAQRNERTAADRLKIADIGLDNTIVRAPFAGVVIAKAAQPGEIVSPLSAGGGFTRTGVGTIADMDSLEIEVDVNESYINRVRAGAPAQAVLDAYQDWTIPARVIAIIPTADRGKATVKVRIGLEQKDPRVLPDMGARVSFMEDAPKDGAAPPAPPRGVLVPATAIVPRDGGSVVFVIDGERVRAQAVAPGQAYGELRLVEGIAASTRVVRTPPAEMMDGARVEVGAR